MERSITKFDKNKKKWNKEMITPFIESKTSILPNLAQETLLLLAWKLSLLQNLSLSVCVERERENWCLWMRNNPLFYSKRLCPIKSLECRVSGVVGALFTLLFRQVCVILAVKTHPWCAKNRNRVKTGYFWLTAGQVHPHCGWSHPHRI